MSFLYFNDKNHYNAIQHILQEKKLNNIRNYRGFGKQVAVYLLSLRRIPNLTVTNKTIASHFNCSIRTVQRWTSQFVNDGWLIKNHRDYELNHYSFNISKKQSYDIWLNLLPQPDIFMQNGAVVNSQGKIAHCETVIPIFNYIYINNTSRVPTMRARGGNGSFSKKRREVVNEEAKKLLREHKGMVGIREIMESEAMQSELFCDGANRLEILLELSRGEKLKLVAFEDEVVEGVSRIVEGMSKREVSEPVEIKDRMAWLIGLLQKHSKRKADWSWYFDVCMMIREKPMENEKGRPIMLGVKVKKKWEPRDSKDVNPEYKKVWEAPKVGDRVAYLNSELVLLREQAKDPEKYFPSFLMELSIKRVNATIESHENELLTLQGEGNGKQICGSWQSGSMGTSGPCA